MRAGTTRRAAALLALPALCLLALLVLSLTGVSGSSMALLGPSPRTDPGLVAGEPLPIRSDEFQVASPAQLGNAAKGMPDQTWLGLVDLELPAIGLSAPVRHWTALFTPTNLAYQLLGDQHQQVSFAFHWWAQVLLGVVGVYALLLVLRRRPGLAAALAVVGGLSPYAAWWGGPGAILGYWAAAGACVVLALRAPTRMRAVAWSAGGAYLVLCAWFILYPAWFLSLGLVVGATCLGAVVDLKAGWRRLALVGVVVGLPSLAVLLLWTQQVAGPLSAITGTIYPGARVSSAGEASARVLLDAPLNNVFRSADRIAEGAPNQSELASVWMPLPVLLVAVALLVVAVVRRSPDEETDPAAEADRSVVGRWAALGAASATLLLLAWALLPLPGWVGRVTLLERVPGVRTPLAIGLGVVLVIHLVAGRVRSARTVPALVVLLLAVAATVGTTLWAARGLVAPGAPGVRVALVVSAVVALAVAVLVVGGRRWVEAAAMTVLAGIALQSYAVVNPLYQGLAPLRSSPLALAVDDLAAAEPGARWAALTTSAQPVLAASRAEVLSGVTYYPDAELWARLAPDQEDLWNNFSKYQWRYQPTADPVTLTRVKGTNIRLDIALCSPDVAFLDVDYVVSDDEATELATCFTEERRVEDGRRTYVIWRRST